MMGSRHPFIFREPTSSANSPSYLRIPRPDDLQICPPGVAPWPLEKAKAAGEAACINMDSVTTIKARAPIPFSRNSAKLLLAPRLREGRLLASSGSAGGRIGEGQLGIAPAGLPSSPGPSPGIKNNAPISYFALYINILVEGYGLLANRILGEYSSY
jgi:hypothetical protein